MLSKNLKILKEKYTNLGFIIFLIFFNLFIFFVFYYRGGFHNSIPIYTINLFILICWGTIHLKFPDSNHLNVFLNKLMIFSLALLLLVRIVLPNMSTYQIKDYITLDFDNETVEISSEKKFYSPFFLDRSIDIASYDGGRKIIITEDSQGELVQKNNLYYYSNLSLKPFTGVQIIVDETNGNVLEGTSYIIGEKLEKKVYEDDILIQEISYNAHNLVSDNIKSYETIYDQENNTVTRINHTHNGSRRRETTYKDNQKISKERYSNNNQTYEWQYDEYVKLFNSDGDVLFEIDLNSDALAGEINAYHENGNLRYKGYLSETDDYYITESRINFDPDYNHTLESSFNFNNWEDDDPGVIYLNRNDGQLKFDETWFVLRENLPSGDLKVVHQYTETQTDNWQYYHENGELAAQGDYHLGFPQGEWTYYYNNGELEAKGEYVKPGVKGGTWQYFHENGQLKSIGNYLEPENSEINTYSSISNPDYRSVYYNIAKDGIWEYYSENGVLMAKGEYSDGRKIGAWRFREKEDDEFNIKEYSDT